MRHDTAAGHPSWRSLRTRATVALAAIAIVAACRSSLVLDELAAGGANGG